MNINLIEKYTYPPIERYSEVDLKFNKMLDEL
jgi:hypothetical protein